MSAALPPGKTCRDCSCFTHCCWLICTLLPEQTECDWNPSRFDQRDEPKHRASRPESKEG